MDQGVIFGPCKHPKAKAQNATPKIIFRTFKIVFARLSQTMFLFHIYDSIHSWFRFSAPDFLPDLIFSDFLRFFAPFSEFYLLLESSVNAIHSSATWSDPKIVFSRTMFFRDHLRWGREKLLKMVFAPRSEEVTSNRMTHRTWLKVFPIIIVFVRFMNKVQDLNHQWIKFGSKTEKRQLTLRYVLKPLGKSLYCFHNLWLFWTFNVTSHRAKIWKSLHWGILVFWGHVPIFILMTFGTFMDIMVTF